MPSAAIARPGRFSSLTPQTFWQLADDSRMLAEYKVDRNLRYLRTAPPEILKKIFVQYRFFTHYYITDLALLVAKLPFGSLRSCLGEFLSEELGDGDPTDSHPQLYDGFLRTLGVSEEQLQRPSPSVLSSLDGVRASLETRSWAYGVGLRGMGGECLCQIYLSSMHENFIRNPYIQERREDLAWKFWDIHTGEVDVEHRLRTRQAITELVESDPSHIEDLAAGYTQAKGAWDQFWKDIFAEAKGDSHDIH